MDDNAFVEMVAALFGEEADEDIREAQIARARNIAALMRVDHETLCKAVAEMINVMDLIHETTRLSQPVHMALHCVADYVEEICQRASKSSSGDASSEPVSELGSSGEPPSPETSDSALSSRTVSRKERLQ